MENNIHHSSSTNSELDHYIKTNINDIISKTWNLQNLQAEIFRTRKLLKTLEDKLFPNHYKFLPLGNAKFIFDVVIEDFSRWTVKKEILNVFDNCLNNMTEFERYDVSHNLLSKKSYNLYYLPILAKANIRFICQCLNQKLHTISNPLQTKKGNNSGLWIDFNMIDKIASWYINIEALLSEKDQEINNNFCDLILLFQRNVEVVNIKRNLCKTIVVTFTLQKSCVSYSEKYQHIIDGAKTLHILLDYSLEAEYLVRNILPSIYRNKVKHKFNKKRKLSLVMNPYVKIPTRTSTEHDCILYISSSSNSISDTNSISETLLHSEDQIGMQNSISDFTTSIDINNILKNRDLNIIPSHDLDDKILFESEEQLLSVAREFDAFRSVLDCAILSTGTKHNTSINISQIEPQKSLIEKTSYNASTRQHLLTTTNQNVLGITSTPTITGTASSEFLHKVQVTTNIGKVEKAKKRDRHTSVDSINNRDSVKSSENIKIPFIKRKYFSTPKIKFNRLLKSNVKKNGKHKIENSACTDVSKFKFNGKITKENHKIRFKFHNNLLKGMLDKIKNKNKPMKSPQKKNTKHEIKENKSFNVDHYDSITVSGKSETLSQQCRAVDNDMDLDLSISLFRETEKSKPIADSSATEDEIMNDAVDKNMLNPYVPITSFPLSKNALTNSLEEKVVLSTDHIINNTKEIIDITNMRQDSINDDSIVFSAKFDNSPQQCRAIDEGVASDVSISLLRKNKNPKPIADNPATEDGADATNMRQDSIHDDSILSSANSDNSPQQCRAIDEEVVSDVSISLLRKNRKPKPIADSPALEDGAVGQNILNSYVQMTPITLPKNALTDIKNIDKPNNLFNEEKSVENIDVPCCSELKTKNLRANLSSNVSVWSKSAIVRNIQVKLCSKDFFGKYLLIICYNIDTSTIDPIILSEITQFSEKFEDFNKIGAAVLICLKGPNINFLEWRNQFENQEFLQKLKVPLIFESVEHFMSASFRVYLKDVPSEMKILIFVNGRGDIIYKSMFSIFEEVNVVNSLELIRHVQMQEMR